MTNIQIVLNEVNCTLASEGLEADVSIWGSEFGFDVWEQSSGDCIENFETEAELLHFAFTV